LATAYLATSHNSRAASLFAASYSGAEAVIVSKKSSVTRD
jgi:hypothetical protein